MLILLGAAGGALRGLLDAYSRFLDWQSDRRGHRQLPAEQANESPKFRDYFDPVADPIAAAVHSAMGAAAAVLFGTTGQISGAYAAVVVGTSAPVILTQLGRVQSISDAVNGAPQAGTAAEQGTAEGSPQAASPVQQLSPAGDGFQPSVAQSAVIGLTQSPSTVPAPSPSFDERRGPSLTGQGFASPDLHVDRQPGIGARDPQLNGRPVDSATAGSDGALNDQRAPSHPHGPVIGEEGTTR
ncbi:hypothetical protein LIX60_03970 [Streptomyces sp. S07_1.15]|uniref:hypothetical protein n=1 Tax=Streptomyces sp. S07_1.15 TaxID=2873925 RepID=UPI001D15BA5A|nr:hypothetical protein [Streptomyces sp. S07_1.15]MCC3650659.1 hypothetical protein [Streptomyces sp. S07_1.15]